MEIKYFPTDDMIGGFFTNPLQGAKLRNFQEKILNKYPDDDVSNHINGINPQECVIELSYSLIMISNI